MGIRSQVHPFSKDTPNLKDETENQNRNKSELFEDQLFGSEEGIKSDGKTVLPEGQSFSTQIEMQKNEEPKGNDSLGSERFDSSENESKSTDKSELNNTLGSEIFDSSENESKSTDKSELNDTEVSEILDSNEN